MDNNFNQEEISLHQAAQLIALTGINLLSPLLDDSQNTMIYEPDNRLLLGRQFTLRGQKYAVGIELTPFSLVLLDEEFKAIKTMNLANGKKSEAITTLTNWLKDLGVNDEITTLLHYTLPENTAYSSESYGPLSADFVDLWHHLRFQANKSLSNLNSLSGIDAEINIWPHHFDTGTYYPLKSVDGEVVTSVGAGLAIADSMISEPYFYIYGYKKDVNINYADVPALNVGKWLTDSWQGSVLPVNDLSETEALSQIDEFFERSYKFLVAQL